MKMWLNVSEPFTDLNSARPQMAILPILLQGGTLNFQNINHMPAVKVPSVCNFFVDGVNAGRLFLGG